MPTVRAYGERKVLRAALPGVRRTAAETPESRGAGLAAAQAQGFEAIAHTSEQLGRQALGVYARVTEQANAVAQLEAENTLARWEQKRLFDPETGALTVKGKAAMPLPETVGAEFNQAADEIALGLANDQQRAQFARTRESRGLNLDVTLRRHVFGEMQRYEEAELAAYVTNGVSEAISYAMDPRHVGVVLGKVTAAIDQHGARAGLGPEAVEAVKGKATTAVHVGVIDRLLATDQAGAAQIYFDATKGQISGEALDEIEKALEVGTLRAEAQTQSDAIIAAGGTLSEQRRKVKAISDPKLRDEVQTRVEHEAAVQDRITREAKESDLGDAYAAIEKSGSVDTIPPTLWSRLVREGHGNALRNYAKTKAVGVEPETNYSVYYGYLQMASNEPTAFATTNLLGNRHQLSDADFKHLAAIQFSLRQGDAKVAARELSDYRSEAAVIDNSLQLAGIDPKDETKVVPVTYLRQRVGEMSAAHVVLTGKKPTNADIQGFVDDILQQPVVMPGSFWNYFTGGPLFAEKSLLELTIADVPAADRTTMTNELRALGLPTTDAAILHLYISNQERLNREREAKRRSTPGGAK